MATETLKVKVGGAWRNPSGIKIKVGGKWKGESETYVKVDGKWKLAHRSSVSYGTVYYKEYNTATTVREVTITSLEEFNSLVGTSIKSLANVVVNGVTLNATDTNLIVGLEIGPQITSIPDYFLKGCVSFERSLVLPSGLTSIGTYFLSGCTIFNKALTIPSSVTSIGAYFLNNCFDFNKPLTIPSKVTSIGAGFLCHCGDMTSYVNVGSLAATIIESSDYSFSAYGSASASYTTGIKIRGANRAAWMTKFPNRTSTPYRKLVDYGR